MAKTDLDEILARPETLAQEIKVFVSNDPKSIQFRADLAGLLVVAMAASYEACVKETLMSYAGRHHQQFGTFAQNHFQKLKALIGFRGGEVGTVARGWGGWCEGGNGSS